MPNLRRSLRISSCQISTDGSWSISQGTSTKQRWSSRCLTGSSCLLMPKSPIRQPTLRHGPNSLIHIASLMRDMRPRSVLSHRYSTFSLCWTLPETSAWEEPKAERSTVLLVLCIITRIDLLEKIQSSSKSWRTTSATIPLRTIWFRKLTQTI